jgi:hypothetical protein
MPEFPSFIGKRGARDKVLRASMLLAAAVAVALLTAVHFHGNVMYAAVLPVLALSEAAGIGVPEAAAKSILIGNVP